MKLLTIILFVTTAICANAGVLPVEKCHLEDSTCMVAAFQKALPIFVKGIPEMGIDVMDVMDMDDFEFDVAGLQFGLKEGKLKGLKDAVFDDVKWSLKKKRFDIAFHLDCSVKGHYKAGGKVIVLPITGDGQFKLKLKNIQLTFHIDYDIQKGADGKDHVVLKKLSYDFEIIDNANFQLSNLFNGNTELSDTMLKFLNENWKQVSTEFGRPIIDVVAKKLFRNVKTFLNKEAIEDIANF